MLKKLILTAAVVLIALAAAVYLYARSVLSSESVRATLEQQLSTRLAQPVTIGSADASILPRVALKLKNVAIGNPQHTTIADIAIATGLRGLFNRRVEDAEVLVSDGHVPVEALIALAGAATSDTGAGSSSTFTIASVRDISLRDIEFVVGKAALQVDVESSLEGDRLNVSKIAAKSRNTSLEASGALSSISKLQGTFTVTANPLDVDELLTLASGLTAPSTQASSANVGASPTSMRLAVDLSAGKGRFAGYEFSSLSAKLEALPGRVEMPSVALTMFGGTYDGKLSLDSQQPVPRLQVRGQVNGIEVSQLATLARAPGSITGQLGGTIALTCDGTDADSMLKTARGSTSAAITNGVIPGLDMVRTIVLAFGKPSGAPPEGSGSAFSRLGGDFVLQEGVLRTNNLQFQSRDFDMTGRAMLTVPGGTLDADANVSLSKELTAQAGTDLRRYAQEDGRVIVPADIGGTIGDPAIRIDVAAATSRALQNELKRKAKGLLDRLFKKKGGS